MMKIPPLGAILLRADGITEARLMPTIIAGLIADSSFTGPKIERSSFSTA
jgi:hypothetical protein